MAITPHYSWATPDDTNLVRNGASDIRTLANAIDTTLYDPTVNTLNVTGVTTATAVIATSYRTGSRSPSASENVEGFISSSFTSVNRTGASPFYINRISGTTSADVITFFRNGTAAGSIAASTTAAPTLVAPSDYRLKENVIPLADAVDRIKSANVYTYNFIADEDKELRYGFLAHEAQDLMHDLVLGEKDAVDEEGNPVYQQIQETRLIPILTAALKDALLKIDDLEARVKKLEGKK